MRDRYHIGESTLPSLRHFFKFIDFYDTFDAHGFYHKVFNCSPILTGLFLNCELTSHFNTATYRTAQFSDSHKLSLMPVSQFLLLFARYLSLDTYSHEYANTCQDTDFLEAGGPDAYAWNLVRSESDDLLFRHAGTCGAHIFDETKVDTIQFEPHISESSKPDSDDNKILNPGRPVSATWVRKDGSSGFIALKYLVDASGRNGILSTKYLKNRKFNDNFKNFANWAYWKTDNLYGLGTHMEGSPYFEALDGRFGKEPISTSLLDCRPFC